MESRVELDVGTRCDQNRNQQPARKMGGGGESSKEFGVGVGRGMRQQGSDGVAGLEQ